MVAIKAADVDSFVARPDPARRVTLVYGPDAGLVSERVDAMVRASIDDPGDPFSLVRLEGEDFSTNPARLMEEAQTIALFGGRRAVWVKPGGHNIAPAIENILALPACECRVIVEAGDLRRNAPLRILCERAKNAVALPCYADTERDLERLIDAEMRAAGRNLAREARALLITLLGEDRAASRSEIRKLVLYARDGTKIGVEDVIAVVSDASALAIDDLVDAAFAGRVAEFETQFAKARAEGTAAGAIFFAAQRQLAQLHRWRTAIEQGAPFSLDAVQPPVHFRRKGAVDAALKQWNAARLGAAMTELAEAALAARRRSTFADTIAERALLTITINARRRAK